MPFLETPSGDAVDVTPEAIEAQFQAAMNDDGPGEQAPPRRPAPPADDSPAKPRRGRPPKSEQSRTADKPAAAVKDDYTSDAAQFVGGVWVVAASIPFTQPYAVVLDTNADPLVKSLAEGAKHSATIRAFVSSGDSSWVLGLASVTLTMGIQAFQIMRDPKLRAECAEASRKSLKEAIGAKSITGTETETANAAA